MGFEECQLLGVDLTQDSTLTAVSFRGCNLDYARLRAASLGGVVFEKCSMVEADLSLADLQGARFNTCNLAGADWTRAVFGNTDLRGSNLGGLDLRKHDLRGIIITPAQFRDLARGLGIQIVVEG